MPDRKPRQSISVVVEEGTKLTEVISNKSIVESIRAGTGCEACISGLDFNLSDYAPVVDNFTTLVQVNPME